MIRHKTYIIYAPSYCAIEGGSIVLHYLCHLLNEIGESAYLCPYNQILLEKYSGIKMFTHLTHTLRALRQAYTDFVVNDEWNTPIFPALRRLLLHMVDMEQYIVVYPEIIDGNPLKGKYVVRYLMHNPGHFTGHYSFGKHELIVRYSNSFARDFTPLPMSKISDVLLTLSSIPSCYNREGEAVLRKGSAYLIRKGKNKPIMHDLTDSVCIDGLSHKDVADVLRRVECLYCYDPVTAYTWFAQLCGCRVRVLLGSNETPETYRNDSGEHNFIEFTLDKNNVDINEAYRFAVERVQNGYRQNVQSVKQFVKETMTFFNN